jgi:hypothetical protein
MSPLSTAASSRLQGLPSAHAQDPPPPQALPDFVPDARRTPLAPELSALPYTFPPHATVEQPLPFHGDRGHGGTQLHLTQVL